MTERRIFRVPVEKERNKGAPFALTNPLFGTPWKIPWKRGLKTWGFRARKKL